MDYVEKPFTADELADFVRKLVIRREDRLAGLQAPEVNLVTPTTAASTSPQVVNVPGGVFISKEHTWVNVEITGEARIGLDDMVQKLLGAVDDIRFPEKGAVVSKGDPLFTIKGGDQSLTFASPLSGKISKVHHDLAYHLDLMQLRPFQMGWICSIQPSNLSPELDVLKIGADCVDWYKQEIEGLRHRAKEIESSEPAAERASEQEPGTPAEARRHLWLAFYQSCLDGKSA
jgi:glycine cleavage system H lipoate-binding protein